MPKYLLICLVVLFAIQDVSASCGDDKTLKTKIEHLKMEVACASSDSLYLCQKLINDFHPIKENTRLDEFIKTPIKSCGLNTAAFLPVSGSIKILAKQMDEVTSFRPRLVNSVEEFYEHTTLHRARVRALGIELFNSHPELFEGLNSKEVASILEAHDLAKVTPNSVGPDGRPFYRILYEDGYGKKLERITVDALNSRDKVFMEQAYIKYRLNSAADLEAKMQRIEKIADFVDRGMSPVSKEEFGRPMDKASVFLKDVEDRKLAKELEKKYAKVTSKLSYKGLSLIEQKALANHLLIEERFAAAKSTSNLVKLSARLMTHTLMSRGNKAFYKFLETITSKGASKVLTFLDFPMLYFASMGNLGCDELGYHDWIKDPNCRPAIGLTPKIIELLGENWEVQNKAFNDGTATCRVIQETYAQSLKAPKIKSCSADQIEMELNGGDQFKIKLDDKNRIKEIDLKDLTSYTDINGFGKIKKVSIGENGKIEKVCYHVKARSFNTERCLDSKNTKIDKTNELLKSINYQIQKGIACCRKTNPDLAISCPQ